MELINVHVTTRSSKPRVEEVGKNRFRVFVSAAPERGKANKELAKLLSKHLGVPRSEITFVRGEESREKTIRIG